VSTGVGSSRVLLSVHHTHGGYVMLLFIALAFLLFVILLEEF
jgi:hypothetical protein